MKLNEWEKELSAILPEVTELRRALHRCPEVSGTECRTRETIRGILTGLGMEIKLFDGCQALMGTLKNGEGPCIAIRADMDALPVAEQTGLPYASANPGVMHACGHDMHMAFALGSAMWFSRNMDKWQGTLRFLFESDEETSGGGKLMVEQGCLQEPMVSCVLGQHVNPNYPAGTFFCKPGFVSGSSDELRLTVRGKSCHGAYPEAGVDAIVITAQIITAMQSLVSRTISPFAPAALTMGTIEGGTANNIVCGEVRMRGTLRTLSPEIRSQLHSELKTLCEGIAAGMGGSAEMEIIPSYSHVYNDDKAYPAAEKAIEEVIGRENMVLRAAPSLGVESFCYFIQGTAGVYYDIGCGLGTALHTPTFCADESTLLPGIAMQIASVLSLLNIYAN